MSITKIQEQQIIDLLKIGTVPHRIAMGLSVSINAVKHVQRKHGLYWGVTKQQQTNEDRDLINQYVAKFHPHLMPFIESNLANMNRKRMRVFPGCAELVTKLHRYGFTKLSIARCLGVDPGTVKSLIKGTHCSQRNTQKPKPQIPELQIEMIEKPGLLRRIWNKLFG